MQCECVTVCVIAATVSPENRGVLCNLAKTSMALNPLN